MLTLSLGLEKNALILAKPCFGENNKLFFDNEQLNKINEFYLIDEHF